ncbi:hypothetical protein K1719_011908, partial [Acacia pycnantha]
MNGGDVEQGSRFNNSGLLGGAKGQLETNGAMSKVSKLRGGEVDQVSICGNKGVLSGSKTSVHDKDPCCLANGPRPSMVSNVRSNGKEVGTTRVGHGDEMTQCTNNASDVEEEKAQDHNVSTGGSPEKNDEKKKRGRPVRSVKPKAKGGISGKAVQGAANADLGRQLRFLISKYHIKLLVLVETKTSGEKCLKLRRKIGFDSSVVEEAQGFSGGIWVLWKSQDVQVDV